MTTDPLYADLLRERFGKSTWWVTTNPELVDSKLMQGIRRRVLTEAVGGLPNHDDEEVA